MSTLTNILPWAGQVLLIGVVITLLSGTFVKNSRQLIVVVMVLLAAGLFLPIQGLSMAQWLRSALGDPSVLTLIMLLNILLLRLFNHTLLAPATRNSLLLGVALIGIVFYTLALGVSAFDPYRLGYTPILLTALLCLASLIVWLKSMRDMAIILLLPLVAYNLDLLESTNLWDYLLDPVLLIYAVVQSFNAHIFYRSKTNRDQNEAAANLQNSSKG